MKILILLDNRNFSWIRDLESVRIVLSIFEFTAWKNAKVFKRSLFRANCGKWPATFVEIATIRTSNGRVLDSSMWSWRIRVDFGPKFRVHTVEPYSRVTNFNLHVGRLLTEENQKRRPRPAESLCWKLLNAILGSSLRAANITTILDIGKWCLLIESSSDWIETKGQHPLV